MIEGLKSQIKGDELKRLISQQMTKLKNQHERLTKKVDAMRAAAKEVDREMDADPDDQDPYANVSNSGKFGQARTRLQTITKQVDELGFIHDHTVPEETYLLCRDELHFLGVGTDYGY